MYKTNNNKLNKIQMTNRILNLKRKLITNIYYYDK